MPSERKKLINTPILQNCYVSVVIPVRDEALLLQKTLEAFAAQIDLQNLPLDNEIFEIIVLLNNCRDDSAQIARRFQKDNPKLNFHICEIELPTENCNSGFVRRLLMNEAFYRLPEKGGIIMTTDGDTQVSEDWIAANISEIERGADAVGGRILFSDDELNTMNPAARRFHLIDEEYRLLIAELESFYDFQTHDCAPRHHQHFNGSFAVKTEIYKKSGGVPDVSRMEDVAFFEALMRIDAKIRHSPDVKVYTSARNDGRTEVGLSTQINDWKNLAERGEKFFAESAEAIEKRLTLQNNLRRIRQNAQNDISPHIEDIKNLAEEYHVSFEFLSEEVNKQQTFGVLFENVQRERAKNRMWDKHFPPEPVEDAVRKLKKKLEKLRTNQKRSAAV